MRTRMIGYSVAALTLLMVIVIVPSDSAVAVAGVLTGLFSVAAIVSGIRSYRPAKAWIWWIVAGGVVFTSFPKDQTAGGLAISGPVMVLSSFGNLAFVVAPLLLVRAHGGKDRDEALDGWILTLALAVGLRQFLLAGQSDNAVVPQPIVLVLTAVAGVTVAAAVRLVVLARGNFSAWLLLFGSLAGQLIGISLAMANSGISSVTGADILAGISRLALGAAALTPSMRVLTIPLPRGNRRPHARLILLAVSLPIALIGVFVQSGSLVVSFAAVGVFGIVVLLIGRMVRLVNGRERARRLQQLVSELGTQALADDDEATFLGHASARVHASLSVDVVAILPPDDAGPSLRLAAATGLSPTPRPIEDEETIAGDGAPFGWPGHTLRVPLAGGGHLLLHRNRARAAFDEDLLVCVDAVATTVSTALGRYRSEAQVRHAAWHDALTGLPNRALFLRELDAAIGSSPAGTTSLLFIDLDKFKSVNDRLGHQGGDELLVRVTERIQAILPAGDLLARLAGDEFVVLCRDTNEDLTRRTAELITSRLAEPFVLSAGVAEIGGSVGVASHDGAETAEQLIHRADAQMYVRKPNAARR